MKQTIMKANTMKQPLLLTVTGITLLAALAGCTASQPNHSTTATKTIPSVTTAPSGTATPQPTVANLPKPLPSNSQGTYQVPSARPNTVFRIIYPGSGKPVATYSAKNGNGIDILAGCKPNSSTKTIVRYTVTTRQRIQNILLSSGSIICNGGTTIFTVVPPFGRAASGIHVALNKKDLQATSGAYAIGLERTTN